MIYIDKKGFRVETAPQTEPGIVEFFPQGGGFNRKLPLIVFHSIYKPETGRPGFKPAIFSNDWGAQTEYPGYTDGYRWNGWAMPYFDFETALRVAADTTSDESPVRYDAERDAFVYESADWPDEPEIFEATTIEVDGKPIKVYGIGAGSWTWDQQEANDE